MEQSISALRLLQSKVRAIRTELEAAKNQLLALTEETDAYDSIISIVERLDKVTTELDNL